MSDDIQIDMSEWIRYARFLDTQSEKLLEKHMRNAMDGSLDLLVDWISTETPSNYGLLRGSWSTDITGQPFGMTGTVSTPLLYGWPVERGRRPGKMPPVDAIKLWVVRKLELTGKKADSAAFLIARAIGKRGTKGAAMVWKAWARAVSGREIDRIWAYELDRFVKAMAR